MITEVRVDWRGNVEIIPSEMLSPHYVQEVLMSFAPEETHCQFCHRPLLPNSLMHHAPFVFIVEHEKLEKPWKWPSTKYIEWGMMCTHCYSRRTDRLPKWAWGASEELVLKMISLIDKYESVYTSWFERVDIEEDVAGTPVFTEDNKLIRYKLDYNEEIRVLNRDD